MGSCHHGSSALVATGLMMMKAPPDCGGADSEVRAISFSV